MPWTAWPSAGSRLSTFAQVNRHVDGSATDRGCPLLSPGACPGVPQPAELCRVAKVLLLGALHGLDASADTSGECGHLVIGECEDAPIPGEGAELLLLVRHPRREWSDVPVDVPVPGLAAQTQDVEPLGGQLLPERLPDLVHEALQAQVFLDPEVASYW
jgi:hypothetical protein